MVKRGPVRWLSAGREGGKDKCCPFSDKEEDGKGKSEITAFLCSVI